MARAPILSALLLSALALPLAGTLLPAGTLVGAASAQEGTAAQEGAETQDGDAMQDAAAPTPPPVDPSTVLATVAGRPITEGDLAVATGGTAPGPDEPQRRASALASLIDLRAVVAAAEAAGANDEEFERRIAFERDRALAGLYVRGLVQPQMSEERLRARFEEQISAIPPVEEVRASHILLETEEEAREVITALDGGADFAELARARSTGPSGPNGGDLGWFGPGRMVPAFDEAARALEVGAVTADPVQTQFGFHVIKLVDKRQSEPPAFESVAEQVRNLVGQELELEEVRRARESVPVEIEDETLARLLTPAEPATDGASDAPANDAPANEAPADGGGATATE